MTSIITGDIINSRKVKDHGVWMDAVKLLFNEMGLQPKAWDIHRGDAFQLEVANPEKALWITLRIKSLLKSKSGIIQQSISRFAGQCEKMVGADMARFINFAEKIEMGLGL